MPHFTKESTVVIEYPRLAKKSLTVVIFILKGSFALSVPGPKLTESVCLYSINGSHNSKIFTTISM